MDICNGRAAFFSKFCLVTEWVISEELACEKESIMNTTCSANLTIALVYFVLVSPAFHCWIMVLDFSTR